MTMLKAMMRRKTDIFICTLAVLLMLPLCNVMAQSKEIRKKIESIKENRAYKYGEGSGTTFDEAYKFALEKMMESIKIALQSYVPDGSYAEGPSAWSDATNGIYVMMQALMSATGNHYGILYAGGLDVTPYYALQMESQSGIMWNYHDSMGSIDTSYLGWAGEMFGDAALAAQHYKAVVAGEKAASYLDILYFDESLLEGGAELDLEKTGDRFLYRFWRKSMCMSYCLSLSAHERAVLL